MYIEKLWEEQPELVTKALKLILNVNEKAGDRITFSGMKNGVLTCAKYGEQFCEIVVSDYGIEVEFMNRYLKSEKLSKKWFKFMHSVFGDGYVYNYIERRNEGLDKIVNQHQKETASMLEIVDFNLSKSQTK